MKLGLEEGKVGEWEGGGKTTTMAAEMARRKEEDEEEERERGIEEGTTGCWVKFRLMGSCISSRAKVDSSISSAITHCGNQEKLAF